MKEIIEIPLSELVVSKLNVRRHGGKDVASLARSIASKGLIYPLLVRRNAGENGYEIVAGKRRFLALAKLDKSGDVDGSVAPCIVLDAGDDATAIELSLIENGERVPMCPLDQCAAFSALIREGRSESEIAHTFSVPVATVRKRLALAGLVPEAHSRYRNGDIDDKVLQALTLGSKERQRAYFKLVDDPEQSPPPVWQLRQWMLGGASLEAKNALFDVKDYTAPITSDLFNETSYCTDTDEFWTLQRTAVDQLTADLKSKGWQGVTVIEPDQPFQTYHWEPVTKANGGHVVIKLHGDGSVQIEKGLLPQSGMRARRKREARDTSTGSGATGTTSTGASNGSDPKLAGNTGGHQPELTAALRNYVDLVRHSAVCAALLKKPKVALRVLAASLIAGARHITIARDPRTAVTPQIKASVAAMGSEDAQENARASILAALGLDEHAGLFNRGGDVPGSLAKLMEMSDAQVVAVLAVMTTDSLAVGSALIDPLGAQLDVDVTEHWHPDGTLLTLTRGRAVIEAMATEVLGAEAPRALSGTVTHAKAVLAEAFAKNGKPGGWQPKWTAFPAGRYLCELREAAQ